LISIALAARKLSAWGRSASLRSPSWFFFVARAPYLEAQTSATANPEVYPAPAGEPLSTDFAVSVEGQPSPVYVATVGEFVGYGTGQPKVGTASFTSFDFSGTVQVSVIYHQPVTYAQVLPSSSGIVPSISGNAVTFSVSNPGQFVLEVNRMQTNSLQIFANAPEPPPPAATAGHPVLYFGPGVPSALRHHIRGGEHDRVRRRGSGDLRQSAALRSRALHPHARAYLLSSGLGDRLRADGELSMDTRLRIPATTTFSLQPGADGLDIEGVTLRDSGSWNLVIDKTQGAQVSNIKEFGWRLNSDGIDINSSSSVTISDGFLRTYDDLVAIKTDDPATRIPATDITVQHMVLWNEKAHALTVGYEMLAPRPEHSLYRLRHHPRYGTRLSARDRQRGWGNGARGDLSKH
jgi:hypothetical protein